MGLGGFLNIADPGDIVGGLSGSTGREAARRAEEITNEELMRQFDITQENLAPFLESAQRQLPGISQQVTAGGFSDVMGELSPELREFLAPTVSRKGDVATEQMIKAGLLPNAGAVSDASAIDPALFNQLLLGTEADLFGNRLALSGLGEGAGTALSELGQRTGSGLSQSNIQSQMAQQQATAAGQQNALSLAGLAASFFSDERLKDNIEDIGEYKGVRIIRWDWKEFVPESWRDVTVGFSAQDILSKFPQFVTGKNGYLAIDKNSLIEHLEAI